MSGLEAVNAGLAIGIVSLFLAGLRVASSLDTWVVLLLAGKPLVDLFWRTSFFQIGNQEVNVQSLVGVLVLMLTAAAFWKIGRRCIMSGLVAAFLSVAAFSAVISPDPGQALNELVRLFAGVAFFVVAGLVIADESRFERFTGWFLAAVSVPVILSFFQVAGLLPFEYWDWIDGEEHGRATGTYPHPLGLIYFLMYAIPLALYLRNRYPHLPRVRWLSTLFVILSLIAVVLTTDRTAYVVFLLQFGLWFAMSHRLKRSHWIAALALLAMMVIAASSWLVDLFSARNIGEWGPDFLRGRGLQWIVFASSYVEGGPVRWLIGKGASVATGIVPGIGVWSSDEPHNDYVRLLHAYGIIGLLLYLMILVRIARLALILRRNGSEFQRNLGAVVLVVIPSILLFSMTTEPMRYPTSTWYLFALASVVQVHVRRMQGAG